MVVFGNKIVTVFNRHFDSLTEEETWIPTVLNNVNLVVTKGANIRNSGIENADTSTLFLDEDSIPKEKVYLPPKEYGNLTLEDKRKYFTFQQTIDFYVAGDVSDVETITSGFFEYMVNHYDNVFRVTTVDEYKDVMPHMEIGGK